MTCPNCGQEFDGGRCPHCGRPTSNTGSRIAAVFLLVFLVLPAGLFGACSVLGLAGASSSRDLLTAGMCLVFAAGGLGLAYWAMQRVKELWG
jgi:hypothetical protein